MKNTPKGKLNYTFIFSNVSPWSTATAFEQSLADFFDSRGIVAKRIPGPDNDSFPAIWLEKGQDDQILSAVASSSDKRSQKPKSVTDQLNSAKNRMK